jgi:WD40 repeat protein
VECRHRREMAKLEGEPTTGGADGHADMVYSCAWSPGGMWLASASEDGTVRVWDVNTWLQVAMLQGHGDGVHCCAWSPDGTQLASSPSDETARVWDINTGREVAILEGHAGIVYSCVWSPAGAYTRSR